MRNVVLIKKAYRDLWQRRGLLLAIILVLAIGVAFYVGMAGIYQNLNGAKNAYYKQYALTDFVIDVKRAPESSLHALRKIEGVSHLRGRVSVDVMVTLPDRHYRQYPRPLPGTAMSMPFSQMNQPVNRIDLLKGRWFSSNMAREVILDEQFAKARGIQIGDHLSVQLPNETEKLVVIGTAYAPEFVMLLPRGGVLSPDAANDAIMYLPRGLLQQQSGLADSYNQLLGLINPNAPIPQHAILQMLQKKLAPYGVAMTTLQKDMASVKELDSELHSIQSSTTLFPGLFLIVAVLILNVMMGRMITQQRTIIGTLKALGYNRAQLFTHYLYYGFFVGMAGSIIGVLLGMAFQKLLLMVYAHFFVIPMIHFDVVTSSVMTGVAIALLSAMAGCLSGAYKATKLLPAEAMRPPVPEKGQHILLERWHRFWASISFMHKMVVRSVCRNRFRSMVTVASSFCAMSLLFASLSFTDSMNFIIHQSFDLLQHQQFTLALRDPISDAALSQIQHLPGVDKVEGQLNIPVKISVGSDVKKLAATGIPEHHHLFTPVDRDNKAIHIPKIGLVINQRLATRLRVKVGDRVAIEPLIANRRIAKVPVTRIITSYLGDVVYANQHWLSHLTGSENTINSVLLTLSPGAKVRALYKEVARFGNLTNITNLAQQKALLKAMMEQFMQVFVLLMVIFAAIVAIGAILNTAMISLSERERDIACLRTLGYSSLDVANIFFNESGLLNVMGILLGSLGGILLAYIISKAYSNDMYQMPFVVSGARMLEAVLIMLVFVLISQALLFRIIKITDWLMVLKQRE